MKPRKPPALSKLAVESLGFRSSESATRGGSGGRVPQRQISGMVLAPDAGCDSYRPGPERPSFPAALDRQHPRLGSRDGWSFALWRTHYPQQLHGIAETIMAIALAILVLVVLFFPNVLTPKASANDVLSSVETAQRWNRAEDEADERFIKWWRRLVLAMYACVQFVGILLSYCFIALLSAVPLGLLVGLQVWWLLCT